MKDFSVSSEVAGVLITYQSCNHLDIASALNGFVPLSRLMAEQIAGLKQWSVGRAHPSTSTPDAAERKLRKLGV